MTDKDEFREIAEACKWDDVIPERLSPDRKRMFMEADITKIETALRNVHNNAIDTAAHSACDAVHHVSCKPLNTEKKGHYIAKYIRRLRKE